MKKIFLGFFITLSILILGIYLTIFFLIPNIINSPNFSQKISKYFLEKYNATIKIENINFEISPKLQSNLDIKYLKIDKNNKIALEITNFKTNIDFKKIRKIQYVEAQNINLNLDELNEIFNQTPKKSTKNKPFNLNKIPNIKIQNILISKEKDTKFYLKADNFLIKDENNQKTINFNAKLKLDCLINDLIFTNSNTLYIKKNKLYTENYPISLGSSIFSIKGEILSSNKIGNFEIEADNVFFDETMKTILFLQKYKDPNKKFIENFKDFKGKLSFKIKHENNDFSGYAKLTDIEANTVKFDVPLKIPFAEFFIENNEINSYTTGIAGGEIITHKLHVQNLFSKDRIVHGEVKTKITKNMVKKYLPKDIKLKNYIDLTINYQIQNKKIDVFYTGLLPKTTNVYYKNFYSNIINRERMITAHTFKDGKKLYLKEYKYMAKNKNNWEEIIFGDGLFLNINGKMFPEYINCNTNGYVSNSFTGSFGNYVTGGKFNGKLKYNFKTKQITGKFEVIDTIFNNFFVKNAKITADTKTVKVLSNGTYKGQHFDCIADSKNDFEKKIYVNNMDLFLNKFIIKTKPDKKNNISKINIDDKSLEISKQVRKINMDINKWQIKTNLVQINNIKFENVCLKGYLKNSIFKYNIEKLLFAKGELKADGKYNFRENSSIIDFSAKNIDSNTFTKQAFNMEGQVEGLANATLHSQTTKNLKNWFAYITFEIENGSLPQLENIEFSTNKKQPEKKSKVSNYVQFNASKKNNIQSRLKGSFKCNDNKIYEADIKLKHEFSSLFIEGNYNFKKGYENVFMFGKFDNSVAKKTKVFHIPLNWIINLTMSSEKSLKYKEKINKIPPIGIDDKDARYFMININGKPENKNLKINAKLLKN